jgi:hypothetical protein
MSFADDINKWADKTKEALEIQKQEAAENAKKKLIEVVFPQI